MKSGFVAILGKPNVGKSTLLNTILNEKISIVTNKAQTTRNAIQGIYNRDDLQIIFTDTPGIHNARNSLGTYMNKESLSQSLGSDVILYLIDATKQVSQQDIKNLESIAKYDAPIFIVLNKIDSINKTKMLLLMSKLNDIKCDEIIPISALNKQNIEELISTIKKYLHDENKYYFDNSTNNLTLNFKISETIREKIINLTYEEVPHLLAVAIDTIDVFDNKYVINATIICNKQNHKKILISKLNSIKALSVIELKKILDKKVELSLFVRVEQDWLNKKSRLFELGYFKGDNND